MKKIKTIKAKDTSKCGRVRCPYCGGKAYTLPNGVRKCVKCGHAF